MMSDGWMVNRQASIVYGMRWHSPRTGKALDSVDQNTSSTTAAAAEQLQLQRYYAGMVRQ